MACKRVLKALFYPHIAVMTALLPVATVFLVCSMTLIGTESVAAYISYVLSAYTLTVWCLRVPDIIKHLKTFKHTNRYAKRWFEYEHLRINVTLHISLIYSVGYGAFQLALGIYHKTFWFTSLASYYVSLAVMRFFLLRHTRLHKRGEEMRGEYIRYRACGFVFLLMSLAISVIIFFMVYCNRTFEHHEITVIAMADYTFTSLALAIINTVRYRRYGSPIYSAARAIGLASGLVSMLTLESAMLTAFGEGESEQFRRIMLATSGAAISLFIIGMAIYMIIKANKNLQILRNNEDNTAVISD